MYAWARERQREGSENPKQALHHQTHGPGLKLRNHVLRSWPVLKLIVRRLTESPRHHQFSFIGLVTVRLRIQGTLKGKAKCWTKKKDAVLGHLNGSVGWMSNSWFWLRSWSQGCRIESRIRLHTECGACLGFPLSLSVSVSLFLSDSLSLSLLLLPPPLACTLSLSL